MVKNIIPKLGMSSLVGSFRCYKAVAESLSFNLVLISCHSSFLKYFLLMKISLFCLSFMSGGAGYQPTPAADGAVSLGDGLGGNAVSLQSCVPF